MITTKIFKEEKYIKIDCCYLPRINQHIFPPLLFLENAGKTLLFGIEHFKI